MRQNYGELRKKSSLKFGFAKRCRIDPKFGASTQKASQIRHSPKFALFSGFKLWRIVRSPTNHRSALFSPSKRAENRCEFFVSGILSGRDKHWDIIITFTVVFRPRAFISYPYRLYLTKFLKMALLISAVGGEQHRSALIPLYHMLAISKHTLYQKIGWTILDNFF